MSHHDQRKSRLLGHAQLSTELVGEGLSLVAALYGPAHPQNSTFDILTGSVPDPNYEPKNPSYNGQQNLLVTRAIVYTDEYYRNWDIVKTEEGEWYTSCRSLEEFVKELGVEFGNLAADMDMNSGGDARDALGLEPLK